jgi:hypothetical protein
MELDREKMVIERKLARCRQLAEQFADGPTANHIRELQAELQESLRVLDECTRRQGRLSLPWHKLH